MRNFKKKFKKSFNQHYQFNDNLAQLKEKLTFEEKDKSRVSWQIKWISISFVCLLIIGLLIASPQIINPQSGQYEVKFISAETLNIDGINQTVFHTNEDVILLINLDNPASYLIKTVTINDEVYDVNEAVSVVLVDLGSFTEIQNYEIEISEIYYEYNEKSYKVSEVKNAKITIEIIG